MNNHKKFNNKNTLLEANPRLKPGVLRSSQLACFWNNKFRTKVRGFKPSEISYKKIFLLGKGEHEEYYSHHDQYQT